MIEVHHYAIRAGSREALLDKLEAAQVGKTRPFVAPDENGDRQVDPSRIRYPYEEMTAAVFNSETGDEITPSEPTGDWLCEVWLTEPDAELAAMAEPI
ncbi:MAG: hypothetical protein CVT71_01955 [Alphaproteobacteria bacterium HGW-Alphaproteobacteria-10]|jgi:hypothetical protein|nr:MAG: hypothetical protein CVT71_01955 [Alphaproteobacteria bacterium HGW-Alphaproteobacteria-10]